LTSRDQATGAPDIALHVPGFDALSEDFAHCALKSRGATFSTRFDDRPNNNQDCATPG
jgi:hypothetical protein